MRHACPAAVPVRLRLIPRCPGQPAHLRERAKIQPRCGLPTDRPTLRQLQGRSVWQLRRRQVWPGQVRRLRQRPVRVVLRMRARVLGVSATTGEPCAASAVSAPGWSTTRGAERRSSSASTACTVHDVNRGSTAAGSATPPGVIDSSLESDARRAGMDAVGRGSAKVGVSAVRPVFARSGSAGVRSWIARGARLDTAALSHGIVGIGGRRGRFRLRPEQS